MNPSQLSNLGYAGRDPYGSKRIEIVKCRKVNSFYGHSSIIRRYCGYSISQPLPYVLQHGTIGLSQDFYEVRHWYKREQITRYWSWNHVALEQALSCGSRFNVEILGCPFLYLVRMLRQTQKALDEGFAVPERFKLNDIAPRLAEAIGDINRSSAKKAPLVFAPHSLPNKRILSKTAHQEFARHLVRSEGIDSGMICLHPYDVFLGNHHAYTDAGFTAVSCMDGVISNHPIEKDIFWKAYDLIGIEYLVNLYFFLMRASACYFCGLSTPLFYAGYLKLQCRLIDLDSSSLSEEIAMIKAVSDERTVSQDDLKLFPRLGTILHSNGKSKRSQKTLKDYCNVVLGAHHILSPRQLLNKLDRAYLELQAIEHHHK